MLPDRKRSVERLASNRRLRRQLAQEYGAFLRMFFGVGDWFVTLTFRDRGQDLRINSVTSHESSPKRLDQHQQPRSCIARSTTKYPPDPRLDTWEPDSKYRHEPGPPVRDAALREIKHWLMELGWEAAGRKRQEIFERLAEGLYGSERKSFAKTLSNKCLICAVLNEPITHSFYYEIEKVATRSIGGVIGEELGRVGGRWHVHLLIRGVRHLRRRKWWKRAFVRFGRSRIEPIHE